MHYEEIMVLVVFIQYPSVIHDLYHFLGQGTHFWIQNLNSNEIDSIKSNMAAVLK